MNRPVIMSAVATPLSLIAGIVAGVAIAASFDRLTSSDLQQFVVIPLLAGLFGGAALWGYVLARIHKLPEPRKIAVAGSLGVGLSMAATVKGLLSLEKLLIHTVLPGFPIHLIFTMLFAPATFLVASIGAGTILFSAGEKLRWWRAALATGLVASAAFLSVDLLLDTLGMRVGGPGAAEHFTMLTVGLSGSLAAAFFGGAMLGLALSKLNFTDASQAA